MVEIQADEVIAFLRRQLGDPLLDIVVGTADHGETIFMRANGVTVEKPMRALVAAMPIWSPVWASMAQRWKALSEGVDRG